jgi:hypothetical protein
MNEDRQERFGAYVDALAEVIGYADRAEPLRDYCLGLLRACRKLWRRPHDGLCRPQGSRMSLAGDDPEHVVVVPGGLLAPTAEAGLTAAIGGNKVEGDFA